MGKDGNVLFNDTLNTFHLRLYGVEHMVKDYEDSQRRNSATPLHGLLFSISGKGSFTRTNKQKGYIFVVPVVEHWLERGIAQWVHHEG